MTRGRRRLVGGIVFAGIIACGGDTPPTASAAVQPHPEVETNEPVPSDSSPAPLNERPAKTISAEDYWYARALGRVTAQLEREGGLLVDVVDDEGTSHARSVGRSAVQDGGARDRAYRRAIRTLGRDLASTSDAQRTAAAQRFEQLTKTERGPAGPWLRWYREFGDFLRWNHELERLEVDEARKAAATPMTVDGLRLGLSAASDRFKNQEPIRLTITVEPTPDVPERWVQTRLSWPDDIEFEVTLEEDDRTTVVELRTRQGGEPVGREDYQRLGPGATAQVTYDLREEVEGSLAPGHYAVRVRYRNEDPGDDLQLEALAGDTDDPGDGSPWTGEIESLTLRFRVVPW